MLQPMNVLIINKIYSQINLRGRYVETVDLDKLNIRNDIVCVKFRKEKIM